MTRKQRVHYNGAVYHVTARGNNRQVIFKDEFDKMYYLSLLRHYKEKFECKLYAYVLMDNHVHLLIKVANQPLSKFMQGVQQCYTQYYNKARAVVMARSRFIYQALKSGLITGAELARQLNVSQSQLQEPNNCCQPIPAGSKTWNSGSGRQCCHKQGSSSK